MVISCAAVNCTNRQGKVDKTEVSFHRFPIKNLRRLAKWKQAVRRENWKPNKYSFLCSKHFTPDCFLLRYEDQHRQLKASAVPSVFDFSPKDSSTRGSVRKKLLTMQVPEEEEKEEEAVPCEKPKHTCKDESGEISAISTPVKNGNTEAGRHDTDLNPNPEATEDLPSQPLAQSWHTLGEWSHRGVEEVFEPSSRSFIDALHSYSSTSYQEREVCRRRAPNPHVHTSKLVSKPGQGFALVDTSRQPCDIWSRGVVRRQLRRRAKLLYRVLQIRRFRRDLELNTGETFAKYLLGYESRRVDTRPGNVTRVVTPQMMSTYGGI